MHKDKDGNIISDSRRDRIEKEKNLSELIITYTNDQLAGVLLKSYNAAVADPNNELIHLYEIRDALSKKFRNESTVRKNLAITSSQWSRLRQLSNDEPLKKGRHRGKAVDTLREATESELAEAREISRAMIESYLQSLEDLNT